ncbi:hypothetical protein SGPA1_11191 [Streptomyces misionensis JCM 4497]
MAGRAPGRAAGFRDHLHTHRGRRRGGHRVPAAARSRGGLVHGQDGERGPAAGRGRPAAQPGQGAGGHLRAGDGFRQAGPGLRGPPRLAVLTDRLLPAGGSRGPRREARGGAAAAGQGGRGDLALLRRDRLPARGTGAPDPRGPRRGGAATVRAGPGRLGGSAAQPAGDDAEGAGRGRRRAAGEGRMDGHGVRLGVRHRAVRTGGPAARGRAAGDALLRHHQRVPHGVPASPARRRGGRAVRSLRQLRGRLGRPRRLGGDPRGGGEGTRPPGGGGRAAPDVADGHARAGRRPQGAHPGPAAVFHRPGAGAALRHRLGQPAAATAVRAGARRAGPRGCAEGRGDGPRGLGALSGRLDVGRPGRLCQAGRSRRGAVPDPPPAGRVPRPGSREHRAAPLPRQPGVHRAERRAHGSTQQLRPTAPRAGRRLRPPRGPGRRPGPHPGAGPARGRLHRLRLDPRGRRTSAEAERSRPGPAAGARGGGLKGPGVDRGARRRAGQRENP